MTARNSVPLRGRDAELARIKRRLQEVAAGVGAVIVIEGRAGLGKTRLRAGRRDVISGWPGH